LIRATATATVANYESDATMTTATNNRNHNNHNEIVINGVLYTSPITATTATTNGIAYNARQFNAYGNPIYTSNTSNTTYNLNVSALNYILYDVAKKLEIAINWKYSDIYNVVSSATTTAIHELDVLLSVLNQYKSNNLSVYNAFYAIMEQRQRLRLQLQFMQFCVADEVAINNEYKKIATMKKEYNNDVWLLRVWYAKKHKKEINTATVAVEKMQHGNEQRHVNNMQVLRGVMLSLFQYAR
jgi:hypothetical protein